MPRPRPATIIALLVLCALALVAQPAHGFTLCQVGTDEYTCTSALFGVPPVRTTLVGTLVDARNGTLQDGSPAGEGCGQFSVVNNSEWVNAIAAGENVILLVDRGSCSFFDKVYNAQSATYNGNPAGVAGVIAVYDDDPNPLPYMVKNSTVPISVSSVLVGKTSGIRIRQSTSRAVSIQFFIPNPDGTVEYELVASVARDGSTSTQKFNPGPLDVLRSSWFAVVAQLGTSTKYTPYIRLQRGCKSSSYPSSLCASACTNNQLYCAPLPIPPSVLNTNSAFKIVQEAIRQYALYLILKDKRSVDGMFAYYRLWYASTDADCLAYEESCSLRIMRQVFLGNDYDTQVMSVIKRNGQGYDPGTTSSNSIAETMLAALLDFAPIETASAFYVNQVPVSASPTCPSPIRLVDCSLLQIVCDGFEAGTAPAACSYDVTCPFGQQLDKCGECDGDNSCTSIGLGTVVAVAIVGMVIVGGIVYVYMRRQQQRTTSDIDRLLKQYLPDSEGLGDASTAREVKKKQERRLIELTEADFSASDDV